MYVADIAYHILFNSGTDVQFRDNLMSLFQEASVAFNMGERYEVGSFTLECLEVHRNPCFIESRVTLRKRVRYLPLS